MGETYMAGDDCDCGETKPHAHRGKGPARVFDYEETEAEAD